MQKTIEKKVVIVGTGIHLGRPVRVNINPAPTNHGIVFKRLDVDHNNSLIEANFKNILSGELCTTLVNKDGISVKTVEHLLAAFSGLGISNALVEIDNTEGKPMNQSENVKTNEENYKEEIPAFLRRQAN